MLGVGAAVLRGRGCAQATARTTATTTHHHHDHAPPSTLSARGLVAMGASAGLIPCPSALVVLLGAVAQHQIALGLLLIVAFSAGLAATLTGARARGGVDDARAPAGCRCPGGRSRRCRPLSAIAIVGVGIVLTAQALPQVA